MKNSLLLLLLMLVFTCSQAQDYQISFTGSGESTAVDSVQVLNLMQGTSVTMDGSDVLYLQGTVGINDINGKDDAVHIFPNPMRENSQIVFYNDNYSDVRIDIFDMTGRLIASKTESVPAGISSFEVSALNTGVYSIVVSSDDWQKTANLISTGKQYNNTSIHYIKTNQNPDIQSTLKNNNDYVDMQYTEGDRLLFRGFSMNYGRVITLIPMESQTVDFNYVPCSDGDGNSYPVVTIGTQIWMNEALRTTTFNDGEAIPNVTDQGEWNNLTTAAYAWYDNDKLKYELKLGALYNWYAVGEDKLCPAGWHVPTDVEYTTMVNYLGTDWMVGGKMKETGTIEEGDGNWNDPNTDATNELGFSLRATGEFASFKSFVDLGYYSYTWTSTEYRANLSNYLSVSYNSTFVYLGVVSQNEGLSVRCLKDD